jgi:hypothetical protein
MRGDEPRIVSSPISVGQVNRGEWTHLVDRYLPTMWDALCSYDAPFEMRHEACLVAWLRLTQHAHLDPGNEIGSWLVLTARVELERSLARTELHRPALRNVPRPRNQESS